LKISKRFQQRDDKASDGFKNLYQFIIHLQPSDA